MPENNEKPVGLTKDTGFQVGVRRTLPISLEAAWDLLLSPRGLHVWLGEPITMRLANGARYKLADGSDGQIRVLSPGSHIRLTWDPGNWPRASTIQARVIPAGDRTVIAFHQEHLPDQEARQARHEFFTNALDELERIITVL